jgi:hypothetical protein
VTIALSMRGNRSAIADRRRQQAFSAAWKNAVEISQQLANHAALHDCTSLE